MVNNVVEHFAGLQGEVVGVGENIVQSRGEVAPVGVGSFDDVHSDCVWWHGTAGQSSMIFLVFFSLFELAGLVSLGEGEGGEDADGRCEWKFRGSSTNAAVVVVIIVQEEERMQWQRARGRRNKEKKKRKTERREDGEVRRRQQSGNEDE